MLFCYCSDPAWGSWGSWSACSRTCQGGYQYRTRRCINGSNRDCSSLGSSTENQLCNTDVTCRPREVEKWSECTKSCGQGVQFMRRSNGSIVWRQCNEQTCHNEPCLQGTVCTCMYILMQVCTCTCTLYLYFLGVLSDALDESKFKKKLMDIPCKNYDNLQKHKFYNYCTIGCLIVYSSFLFLYIFTVFFCRHST